MVDLLLFMEELHVNYEIYDRVRIRVRIIGLSLTIIKFGHSTFAMSELSQIVYPSQIRKFWSVLRSFTQEEKALFLHFVTGTSRVPLEGFSHLKGMRGIQKFNISRAFGNSRSLPQSSTCFNTLKLPSYDTEEMYREKLLLAIREGSTGFGIV